MTEDEMLLTLYRALNWFEHGRPQTRMRELHGWTKASDDVIALLLDVIEWLEGANR